MKWILDTFTKDYSNLQKCTIVNLWNFYELELVTLMNCDSSNPSVKET